MELAILLILFALGAAIWWVGYSIHIWKETKKIYHAIMRHDGRKHCPHHGQYLYKCTKCK